MIRRLFLALLVLASAPAAALDVLVVVASGDSYELMARGAALQLERDGLSVEVVGASERNLRARLAEVETVLGVGSPAVEVVCAAEWRGNLVYVVYDPESLSLPEQPGFMTGIALRVPFDQQLAQLRLLLPGARRVGVLYDPLRSSEVLEEAKSAARRHGIEVVGGGVRRAGDLLRQARLLAPNVDVLWALDQSVLTRSSLDALTLYSLRNRLPLLALSKASVDRGALAAVVPDLEAAGVQAAEVAGNLTRSGAASVSRKPRTVSSTELIVNPASARRLEIEWSVSSERGHP